MSTSGTLAAVLAQGAPAGGAETAQVVGATAVGGALTSALLLLGYLHRSGRSSVLARVAGHAARSSHLPAWAALPVLLATSSLLTALFGMYWDISLHIDNGRDPGPLANPSHYFILFGLFGLFSAGFLALVLPEERPGAAAIRLTRDWHVPVGGLVVMACGAFALIGFPLDDLSHRLFGQDVTLWGPTHLMLIGGAGLSLFGVLMLLAEGRQARQAAKAAAGAGARAGARPERRASSPTAGLLGSVLRHRAIFACGGLLIGMSVFQGEFDFGVPQFRLLFEPVLIALAAGVALVCGRMVVGPGGALGAVLFFVVVRGFLALVVGGAFANTTPHLPLYLAEGLLVEGVALWLGTRRALRFGVVAGGLVGTVGTLAEWGWSHVWMPLPWPGHLMGEVLALTLPVGVAAGVLGAWSGAALQRRPAVAATRTGRSAALAGVLTLAAVAAYLAPTDGTDGLRGAVTLEPAPGGRVVATVRLSDPAQVRDADWLNSLAWQGRGPLHQAPLRELAPGVFRSQPMPVGGTWKSMVRLHRGSTLAVLPVFLPEDPAIPAAGVPASASFTRDFVPDSEVLQRERASDVPGWAWAASGLVVLGCFVLLLALLGWALVRVARTGGPPPPARPPAAVTATGSRAGAREPVGAGA